MSKKFRSLISDVPRPLLERDTSDIADLIESLSRQNDETASLQAEEEAERAYRLKMRNELMAKFKKQFPNGGVIDAGASFLE